MHILIVDDEKNIRSSLSSILKDEGHSISTAEDGESALRIINEQNIDLMFLDVKLPGVDGMKVLETIKQYNPEIDVLMISGHSDIFTAVKAVKIGAYDFMEKPLSLPKVTIATRNIDDKRKFLKKYISEKQEWDLKHHIVGSSEKIQNVMNLISRVSLTDSKVLITGESGTGKELVAYAVHKSSRRKNEAFVKFNSAAIPKELVESELFGYEKGAFTGADKQKIGKLELADSGTLFLDEIGDMNLEAQAKILRVLEEGKFERVGGNKTINIDVRILAATNRNLEEMSKEGTFREDLYYRLNVVPINVPPLRDRKDDIPELINYYLEFFAHDLKIRKKQFTDESMDLFKTYLFPGNIRELKNLMERLYILVGNDIVTVDDIRPHVSFSSGISKEDCVFDDIQDFTEARKQFEKRYLEAQLEKFNWNISKTAQNIGLQQPNLSRKIKDLKINKLE